MLIAYFSVYYLNELVVEKKCGYRNFEVEVPYW